MFTKSSLKSHSLTAVQIYGVRVNLCTLLASKVSLPSCTMCMIFLYNYIYFLRNATGILLYAKECPLYNVLLIYHECPMQKYLPFIMYYGSALLLFIH